MSESLAWSAAKQKARERAENRCESCGAAGSDENQEDDLQVHHIRARVDGGTNQLQNLAVVCNSCHWQIHRHGPDDDGKYPLNIASEKSFDDSDFIHPDPHLTPCKKAILSFLEPRGPTQRKEIIDALDYSTSYITRAILGLRIAGLVNRKARGLYELVEDPRED